MKSNQEVELHLKELLKEDIEKLELMRGKLIAKGNRNKSFYLIVLLGALVYFSVNLYSELSGFALNFGFTVVSVLVLVSFIFKKPESLVAEKDIRLFYKMVKADFFQKCIKLMDSQVDYTPLYKTHISHIKNSGFWEGSYTITKEDDGLRFPYSNLNANISDLAIYRSTRKIFSGLFIKVDFLEKNKIDSAKLSEHLVSIKDKIERSFSISVQESRFQNTFYFAINLKREFCEIKLSSKTEVKFENVKEDLLILYNLISFINILNTAADQSKVRSNVSEIEQ
jgi:hypothetical protein